MINEIWKDVKYYEGHYLVSNYGRIKSCERYVIDKNGNEHYTPEKYLIQHDNGHGYLFVWLWSKNKGKQEYIHRLVALAFIDNPKKLSQVNHKDEDKQNNCVDNLEWCTSKYNNLYGTKGYRQGQTFLDNGKTCYRVAKCDLEGNELENYRSMREAERKNNLPNGIISDYFKYGYLNAGGYTWKKIA